MKKIFFHTFFSLFFIVGIFACSTTKNSQVSRGGGEVTTSSGLKYKIYQKGNGVSPKKGNLVTVHYIGRLQNDTIFDSSRKRGEPLQFKLGEGQVIKGWDEGISYLQVGDRAELIIPPDLAYGNRAMQKIPANSTLIFDVELLAVTEGVQPFNIEGKDTSVTSSGLKIIKLNELSKAKKPQSSQNVTVHYTGYLMDGKIFDSSVERGEPITFPLGTGKVIKGWDEGIANMRVGERARLIIPPHLAYGVNGYPPVIPKNATLIFDVELVGVED